MNSTRHYGMDWLRIGAFALLILYHIGMYFVPWGWHVTIAEPFDWVAIQMLATNGWRLALPFLVSAYAGAALPSFLILLAATLTGCWLFYWIGRSIGWLRPLIGLQRQ